MAYLLNKTVFLDNFVEQEGSIEFHARANVGEINRGLSKVYGTEPSFVEKYINYSAYVFGDVRVTYIRNGSVYARLKSEKKEKLRRLSDVIQDLS